MYECQSVGRVILFGTKLALDRGMSRRNHIQNQYLVGKYSNERGGNIRASCREGLEPMPGKILVVDDHAPNRELIREALTDSAYEVSEAVTASEALERLRRHKTDLVVTDIQMPGLSGVELLKCLNKEYPDIVVILMTAFATVAGAVEAMKLGAHDFLTQPLKIDELRLVIQRALDG